MRPSWRSNGGSSPGSAISRISAALVRCCECRPSWQLLVLTLLLSLDLFEFGQRSFKFVIEEPHRIENFAEGCRCFCPVNLSKGKDAIVAQISHYRRVRNFMVG